MSDFMIYCREKGKTRWSPLGDGGSVTNLIHALYWSAAQEAAGEVDRAVASLSMGNTGWEFEKRRSKSEGSLFG